MDKKDAFNMLKDEIENKIDADTLKKLGKAGSKEEALSILSAASIELDDEKLGYVYRNSELRNSVNNLRGMLMICMFAALACILMLLVLQFGFDMDTRIGFIITTLAIAVAVTVIYVKYTDDDKERIKTAKAINRIIL